MAKTVAILQSSYIPWRGYFDIMRRADEFITFDIVQYTKRDWRNRNIIKTANGLQWLTIPVGIKGRYKQAIDETRIAASGWAERHISSIDLNYRRAPAFRAVSPWLFNLLLQASAKTLLTETNHLLLREIAARLGIVASLRCAAEILPRDELVALDPTERLLRLCQAAGASRYLSGPSAKSYLDVARFEARGVEVIWMNYEYPEYPQCWSAFEPRVSIVDLLLNCGDNALNYLGYPN